MYVFKSTEGCDFKGDVGKVCGEKFSKVEAYLKHVRKKHNVTLEQCKRNCNPNHMFCNVEGHYQKVHGGDAGPTINQSIPGPSVSVKLPPQSAQIPTEKSVQRKQKASPSIPKQSIQSDHSHVNPTSSSSTSGVEQRPRARAKRKLPVESKGANDRRQLTNSVEKAETNPSINQSSNPSTSQSSNPSTNQLSNLQSTMKTNLFNQPQSLNSDANLTMEDNPFFTINKSPMAKKASGESRIRNNLNQRDKTLNNPTPIQQSLNQPTQRNHRKRSPKDMQKFASESDLSNLSSPNGRRKKKPRKDPADGEIHESSNSTLYNETRTSTIVQSSSVMKAVASKPVAGPSRLANALSASAISKQKKFKSKRNKRDGETSAVTDKNKKRKIETWKKLRRRGEKKNNKKKPHDKAAKCTFCNSNEIFANIHFHLKECSQYAEVKANPDKQVCILLRKDKNKKKRLCGFESFSKEDYMHHQCHVHRFVYTACNICKGNPIFRDIKKHHRDHHLPIRQCPFKCPFSSRKVEDMNKHIRNQHPDQIYVPVILPKQKSVAVPSISNIDPNHIFTNIPTQYLTIRNNSFLTVYNRARRENVMSISVLSEKNLINRVGKRGRRRDKFKYDKRLHLVQPAAYVARDLDCDASHLECAGHHINDPENYAATFLNSNLVYMYPNINQGIWSQLESHKKKLLKVCDYIVSINGVIYNERNTDTKSFGGLYPCLPTQFYSIVKLVSGNVEKCQVFLIDNVNEWDHNQNLFSCLSTLEEIELFTGLKFAKQFKKEYTYQNPTRKTCQDQSMDMSGNGCTKKLVQNEKFVDCDKDDRNGWCFFKINNFIPVPQKCDEYIDSHNSSGSIRIQCGHPFENSRKEYIFHMQQSHGIVKYACEMCPSPRLVPRQHYFGNHIFPESALITCFVSDICSKKQTCKQSLMRHLKEQHGAHIGYIKYKSEVKLATPSLKDISLNYFFDGDTSTYRNLGGKYFSTYIDSRTQDIRFSISVLQKDCKNQSIKRRNQQFRFDKSMSAIQPTKDNFNVAGYAQGHIESAHLYQFNRKAYNSTFLMSNMVYMTKTVNHCYWQSLDAHKKKLLDHCDHLISLTGIIYGGTKKQLPGGIFVSIPDKLFSIILIFRKDIEPRNQVFLFDNKNNKSLTIFDCRSSFEEIEKLSYLRFDSKFKQENKFRTSWDVSDSEFFKCQVHLNCFGFFTTETERRMHESEAGNRYILKKPVRQNNPKNVFNCKYCEHNSSGRTSLKFHKQKFHKSLLKFVCPKKCGSNFDNKSGLTRHLYKCKGKIACINCKRTFASRSGLDMHIKKHCPKLKIVNTS